MCKLFFFTRKLHFIFINVLLLDTYFYGAHALLHFNIHRPNFYYLLSILNMVLITYDMLHILKVCLGVDKASISLILMKKYNLESNSYKNSRNKVSGKEGFQKSKTFDYLSHPDPNKNNIDNNKNPIDHIATLNRMKENLTIINFAISELNYGEKQLTLGAIKVNSFVYLARLALYQCLIVSLQFLPRFLICLIGMVEMFCLTSGLYLMLKHKYIRSKRVIVHRVLQNISIFLFLSLLFVIASQKAKFNYEVPNTIQLIAMWTIVFSISVEYFFLLFGIVVTLRKKLSKKTKKLEKEELQKLNPVVYKTVQVNPEDMEAKKLNSRKPRKHRTKKKKFSRVHPRTRTTVLNGSTVLTLKTKTKKNTIIGSGLKKEGNDGNFWFNPSMGKDPIQVEEERKSNSGNIA